MHRMLERIAREGVEKWTAARVQASRSVLERALSEEGVAPVDLDAALERTLAALSNAVEDPRGRWLLSAHEDARSEFEIAGVLDGTMCRATIDRTFVDADGTRWIVDFKMSHDREGVPSKYTLQMDRYGRLFGQIETRPIRLGLYFPMFKGWQEWSAQSFSTRLDTSTARTP